MPKIPEILVASQMERSVSVLSDRRIGDNLQKWSILIRLISVRPKLAILYFQLTNKFITLLLYKSHYFQLARFNQKMRFHFARLIILLSDWLASWHNGKHSECLTQPVIILDIFTKQNELPATKQLTNLVGAVACLEYILQALVPIPLVFQVVVLGNPFLGTRWQSSITPCMEKNNCLVIQCRLMLHIDPYKLRDRT